MSYTSGMCTESAKRITADPNTYHARLDVFVVFRTDSEIGMFLDKGYKI